MALRCAYTDKYQTLVSFALYRGQAKNSFCHQISFKNRKIGSKTTRVEMSAGVAKRIQVWNILAHTSAWPWLPAKSYQPGGPLFLPSPFTIIIVYLGTARWDQSKNLALIQFLGNASQYRHTLHTRSVVAPACEWIQLVFGSSRSTPTMRKKVSTMRYVILPYLFFCF